ncbi:MAG: hypothetical protein ABI577_11285 [bacterium]
MSFLRHWSAAGSVGSARRRWAEVAGIVLLSAVAVALIAWRIDFKTIGTAAFADPGWDRHPYREMARRDLLDFKLAPYCWRVLVPWLAKGLPGTHQTGFLSIAVFALVGTGPVVYALVRATGGSRAAAVGLVLAFYSLGWAARFSLSDFWVPDAMSMFLTCLAMWLVVSKRWWAAGIVLVVGVLAKESVIFVAPLAFTWHMRDWRDWQSARRAILVVAPAILMLVGLRLAIQPENGNAEYIATMPPTISRFPELFGEYSYRERYSDITVNDRWAHREWSDLDRYLFDPFGLPLLVVAGAGVIADPRRALKLSPFFVLVYSQLLFATDTQRLLVLAFPALAILGAGGVGWFAKRRWLPEVAFAAVFAVGFAWSLFDANAFGAAFWPGVAALGGGIAVGIVAVRVGWAGRTAAR